MSELVKAITASLSQRIRSPIIGSVFFSHIAWNWAAYFYLFWAESSVSERIAIFQGQTDLCTLFLWPTVTGFSFAVALPFVNCFGVWVAKWPISKIRELQDTAENQRKINKLTLETEWQEALAREEEAREKRILDSARREQEAKDLGPEAEESLKTSRKSAAMRTMNSIINDLGPSARKVLKKAISSNANEIIDRLASNGRVIDFNGQKLFSTEQPDEYQALHDGIQELTKKGILELLDADALDNSASYLFSIELESLKGVL